jgi:biofilm PGA synthesis protein PgaD
MVASAEKVSIDVPELLTARERTRDTLFTALMWLVYVYLWVPLLSFAAWALGFELAYDVMIRSGGAKTLRPALLAYLSILGLIVAVVVLWSLINRARFHNAARRKSVPAIGDEQMAAWFGIAMTALAELRASKRAAIDFDAEGRPLIRGLGNELGAAVEAILGSEP